MRQSAENDAHAPTDYHGRTVCTCGDFNCASLDYPRDNPPGGDHA